MSAVPIQVVHPLPRCCDKSTQVTFGIPNAPYSDAFIRAMQNMPADMAVLRADGDVDVEATMRRICAGAQWVHEKSVALKAAPTVGEGAIIGAIIGISLTLATAITTWCLFK